MEITAYNLHGGSFRPSLGLLQTQAYSDIVRSRRCYEITPTLVGGGSAFLGIINTGFQPQELRSSFVDKLTSADFALVGVKVGEGWIG
jgi:hypothetical protein